MKGTTPTVPNDHHVPRMLLRRFAVREKQQWYIEAADVAKPGRRFKTNVANVAAERDFYTWIDENGDERREVESFLGRIESVATPALRTVLDDPTYALTRQWPLPPAMRLALAWFMAAQIVRTTRQRKRLEAWAGREGIDLPGSVDGPHVGTAHVAFMFDAMRGLTHVLESRSWGLGHSGACLITSDSPLVILNGHDDDNQLLAAGFWDIMFPLDPHRLIFMPGPDLIDRNARKGRDHRIAFDGLGHAFVDATYAAADRFIFSHPDHPPTMLDETRAGRLRAPGEDGFSPEYMISYDPMPPGYTIAQRWASDHNPPPLADEDRPKFTGASFGL
ncbi:DUF4238 domain-containing protein [Micromonospora sp. DT81.3]|uniref:DUF4238 domain-containing protein n=1 Tax=Micromonospora sp. DT81.3 TaxID=3416523 RepID=UPI003CE7DF83